MRVQRSTVLLLPPHRRRDALMLLVRRVAEGEEWGDRER